MAIIVSKKARLLCSELVSNFEESRKKITSHRYDMTVSLMEEFELGDESLLEQELEKFYELMYAELEAMHKQDRETLGEWRQKLKRL